MSFAAHRHVQAIARSVLSDLAEMISADSCEASIVDAAIALLTKADITETWYYECPALVLLGSRSCWSESGRNYWPAREPVGATNLITVDLSPCLNGVWGDCARSYFVEAGRVVQEPTMPLFSCGQHFVAELHAELLQNASPGMTFHELWAWANTKIEAAGYRNLDFLGNVGHTIVGQRDARRFVERQSSQTLATAGLFTFEPHIALDDRWGIKYEEIYFWGPDGKLERL